jgi:1-acyl-sn-glycerol-3-phosphate acyltransferase
VRELLSPQSIKEVDDEVQARLDRLELPFNRFGVDPYGISKKHLRFFMTLLGVFYRHYFRVSSFGLEHVPPRGRAMLVGNHSGGVALDGAMLVAASFFELEPPRLAQGMADKFLNRMPFFSQFTSRLGHFTGLPEHAHRLLKDERLLLVFPEGARGTAKLYRQRHSLVHFGSGFVRLALATRTPIIPFGFVGGGDAIPTIMNLYRIGRLVGAPYLPVTPWVVPLPLPVALEIHIGDPIVLAGSGNEDDATIEHHVEAVKQRIAALIDDGRRWADGAVPPLEAGKEARS